MITQEQLDNWFRYHPPTPEDVVAYQAIRDAGRSFAEAIVSFGQARAVGTMHETRRAVGALHEAQRAFEEVLGDQAPESLELKKALLESRGAVARAEMVDDSGLDHILLAVLHVREAVMWANAARACAPKTEAKVTP